MHGNYQRSMTRRVIWQILHLIFLLLCFWLLFDGGLSTTAALFGQTWIPGDAIRRILVFATSAVLFLRWGFTNFYLLKRDMPWIEIIVVSIELFVIHTAYAVFGGQVTHTIGIPEIIGVGLFVLGSYLNTGSEVMRNIWKKDPENRGRIYDKGLFKHAMHINYFGDVVWSSGMALISGSPWIFLIPLYMGCGFVFLHIPRLDKHLRMRYGLEFERYSKRTKKLIPFIY